MRMTIVQIIQPESGLEPVASKLAMPEPKLDKVFAWFNGGSGEECPEFAGMRSLSVGDYVMFIQLDRLLAYCPFEKSDQPFIDYVGCYVYRCERTGWKQTGYRAMEKAIKAGDFPDWMKPRLHREEVTK